MKKKYIGVTIGPISETINLSSSPASLWMASYLFSSLSREICSILVSEYQVPKEDILSPYFDPDRAEVPGVGLYHDRIILRAGTFPIAQFAQVKAKAIARMADEFALDGAYLKEFLMVSAAEFEAENPVMESGPVLDNLELARTFILTETENSIAGANNAKIKKLPMAVQWGSAWQLLNQKGNIRSLPEISAAGMSDNLKKRNYYAIVRSDGDNMSRIIGPLRDTDAVRSFSSDCLEYCREMASCVASFDGMTIYAGGDDLLAILPCEDGQGRSVLEFVQAANEIFSNQFKKYGKETSLSFGIEICHKKFPLYEALEQSAQLLFGVAKSTKNAVALRLQKHAGQSEGLVISHAVLGQVIDLQKRVTTRTDEDVLLSALYKIAQFQVAFNTCREVWEVRNLFCNTFDADAHEGNEFLKSVLPEFFEECIRDGNIMALTDNGVEEDKALTLGYLLRLMKFYTEEGGEEDAG